MPRYIDPRKIDFKTHAIPGADGEIYLAYSDVRKAIAQTPSEDVVEVVRCKDCKRAEMYNFYGEDVPRLACVEKKNGEVCFATGVEQNHFCSYGERKEQT